MQTVQVMKVASTPLAVMRAQAAQRDFPRVVPELCGAVWKALEAQGLRGGRNVAVYLDTTFRLEVGCEMNGAFAEQGGLVRSATPAGTVATTTFLGPYSGLCAAHGAIPEWCRSNGRELAGPS